MMRIPPLHALIAISVGLLCSRAVCGGCDAQEVAKLLASKGDAMDFFGISSAIDGDTVVIGARQDNEAAIDAGAAYVFRHDGTGWREIAKLIADDAQASDNAGHSVGICGGLTIVGAHRNGEAGFNAGAAYIFADDGSGEWIQVAKLMADDAAPGDRFGWAVDIDGDTAIVGAFQHDGVGVNSGAAYIFQTTGDRKWVQTAALGPADATAGAEFGWYVAIDGDTAIVSARHDREVAPSAGAAYIFSRDDGGTWIEVAKLTASDGQVNDQFSRSLAIHGAIAVVGAPLHDAAGANAGAAYVFEEIAGGEWLERAKLIPAEAGPGDDFGTSVAVHGQTILVAGRLHGGAGEDTGLVAVFRRDDSGEWIQVDAFTSSDISPGDQFGFSAALHGETAVVGARHDDANAENAGSAYIFDLKCGGECPADLAGEDGMVGVADLLALLSAWGACDGCAEDLDGDGMVGVSDLLLLLAAWGPCR